MKLLLTTSDRNHRKISGEKPPVDLSHHLSWTHAWAYVTWESAPEKSFEASGWEKGSRNENFQLSCFDYEDTTRTGCSCEQYRCWRVVKAYFFPLHCLCLRLMTKEILRMENVVGRWGVARRRNNNLWQETTYIVSSHRCLSVACFCKSLAVCVIKSVITWMAFEKLCLSHRQQIRNNWQDVESERFPSPQLLSSLRAHTVCRLS